MTILNSRNKSLLALAMMAFLVFSAQVFGQSIDATLSGTVSDTSGGVLPGATVTATNVATNVETIVLTNDSGLYKFPSLQPGNYKVAAQLEGFQKATKTDLSLGSSSDNTVDFELSVAGMAEEVEVVTSVQDIITESSPSAATVLESQEVADLPLIDNDVLDLVNIMGGVFAPNRLDQYGSEALEEQSFAGVDTRSIHIQQDGLTINDVKYRTGINSNTRINPEMVAEFKLILSPVDAEYGRGAGQVQIITRSGTNQYSGSGVWNINNSSLNARTWEQARQGTSPNWFNNHQYNITFGGPIVKNKTFFFFSWDHAIPRSRTWLNPEVYTPCARKGIYRFFDGWAPGNFEQSQTSATFTPATNALDTPTAKASVDRYGVPLDPLFMNEPYNVSFFGVADRPDVDFYPLPNVDDPPIDANDDGDYADQNDYWPEVYYAPDSDPNRALQFVSVFGHLNADAIADVEADMLNCSQYDPYSYTTDGGEVVTYDHTKPFSHASLQAMGIDYYWELPLDLEVEQNYDDWREPDLTDYPYRRLDTLFIKKFSELMPEANNYENGGDGLNTAVHRWQRATHGSDSNFGNSSNSSRKNITTRLNHNFNQRQRLAGTYTMEFAGGDINQSTWPNGYKGAQVRRPQRVSVSFTSQLNPGLLNEAVLGFNRNRSYSENALDNPETEDEVRSLWLSMVPTNTWAGYENDNLLLPVTPASLSSGSHILSNGSISGSWGGFDHRWQFSDALTWMRGRHAFKFGAEYRMTRSYQDGTPLISDLFVPSISGGATRNSEPYDIRPPGYPIIHDGLIGKDEYNTGSTASTGSVRGVLDLREYMAGSISSSSQSLFVNRPDELDWADPDETKRIIDIRQREMSFYAKDDWRATNSLTLNLGVRWEYYGIPWVNGGLTTGLLGGSGALFGISGRDFSYWMPEVPIDYGDDFLMRQTYIGPDSPNPDTHLFERDLNNFGPAVGFAYQLPWFGRGKTTIRGGYQLTFTQIASANLLYGFGNVLASNVGTVYDFSYSGSSRENKYLRIADLETYFPFTQYIDPDIKPLSLLPVYGHDQNIRMYDPNIRNPYTQSLNFSVSRRIGSHVNMEVRYIGTLARKNVSDIDLNSANWIENGLIDDLNVARAGGTTDRLDNMFRGLSFSFSGTMEDYSKIPVGNPGGPTGGDVMRLLYANNLANGNYNTLADSLANANFNNVVNTPWEPAADEQGALLRHANYMVPGQEGMFPENFILHNPQLDQALWTTNNDHNNYHSMQVRFTLRPTHGFNMNATYTWSKNLGSLSYQGNSGWTNPNDRANPFDYTYAGNSRGHQVSTYGSITLPLGANGFFFRDITNPIVSRAIEGWQLAWIMSMNSGGWSNIDMGRYYYGFTIIQTHLYNGGTPNVGPMPFETEGQFDWAPGDRYGYYFGDPNKYVMAPDPQCFNADLLQHNTKLDTDDDGNVITVTDNDRSLFDDCAMTALYLTWTDDYGNPILDESGSPVLLLDENGNPDLSRLVFYQSMPGENGNYGRNKMKGIGSFSLDMNMSKTVQLDEGRSVGIRVDAGNILNHPSPGGPDFTVDTNNPMGLISSKSGSRSFQGRITLRF